MSHVSDEGQGCELCQLQATRLAVKGKRVLQKQHISLAKSQQTAMIEANVYIDNCLHFSISAPLNAIPLSRPISVS